jgi:hypothetical protein
MKTEKTLPSYAIDESYSDNPLLIQALKDVIRLPEVKEILTRSFLLHEKPLLFTTQPPSEENIATSAGAFYAPEEHSVHILPERFFSPRGVLASKRSDGGYSAFSLQHMLIHEIGHAQQDHTNVMAMKREIKSRIEVALAGAADVQGELQKLQPLQEEFYAEVQRLEAQNVPLIDSIIGKYYGESPRREYENASLRPADEVEGCLVHKGPIDMPLLPTAQESWARATSRVTKYECIVDPSGSISAPPIVRRDGSSNEILSRK